MRSMGFVVMRNRMSAFLSFCVNYNELCPKQAVDTFPWVPSPQS